MIILNRILKRCYQSLLTDHWKERGGSVFSCRNDKIIHIKILKGKYTQKSLILHGVLISNDVKKLKAFYKIIKPFINKYTITIGAFALLMSFGQYSFINRFKLLRNEAELEKEKKQYDDQIEKAKLELQQLNTNKNKTFL